MSKIPSGPAMLLKSLGINPDEIQSKVDNAGKVLTTFVQHVDSRFDTLQEISERVETNTLKILEHVASDVTPAGENSPGFYEHESEQLGGPHGPVEIGIGNAR